MSRSCSDYQSIKERNYDDFNKSNGNQRRPGLKFLCRSLGHASHCVCFSTEESKWIFRFFTEAMAEL